MQLIQDFTYLCNMLENINHKAGFVNIFGPPNVGKSTLINALIGEQVAIVSPKVQTTRHRIHGFLSGDDYQIIFSDTPGIIEPKYELHHAMMKQVKNAIEDVDIAIFMADIDTDPVKLGEIVKGLKIKSKTILIVNKIDLLKKQSDLEFVLEGFKEEVPTDFVMPMSVDKGFDREGLLNLIIEHLPYSPPFFPKDDISDRNMRFFVSEMIREQIYFLYEQEIPYHTAVLIQSYKESPEIVRISADIIVTRESQKIIMLGKKGSKIKQLGIESRKSIEEFIGQQVYLELFVKVRPKWRDNQTYLKEYGY